MNCSICNILNIQIQWYNIFQFCYVKPPSDQEVFPRRLHEVLKFSRTPRKLQGKIHHLRNNEAMASSSRPHGVLVASNALLRSTHCILSRSCGVLGCVSSRLHDVFTALARRSLCIYCLSMAFAPRFHGVLPLRWRLVGKTTKQKRSLP